MANSKNDDIDEALYSRQLYVLGHEAMRSISGASILISGIGGLGVEIAKNVILAGVKMVMIHDESSVRIEDLSSQFFLSEEDIGKNRAESSLSKLRELNSYVEVNSYLGPLKDEELKKYQVVVVTDCQLIPFDDLMHINDFCRSHGIHFIFAETKGVFGRIFCDFGEEFTVLDTDGEPPYQYQIHNIVKGKETEVIIDPEVYHQFDEGDCVVFSEVQGMTELNGLSPQQITSKGRYSIQIGDTSSFGDYKNGGLVTYVKKPVKMTFKCLRDSIKDPVYETGCFNEKKLRQSHLAFLTLHEYFKKTQTLPNPWSVPDADHFLEIARSLQTSSPDSLGPIDETLLRKFSFTASGILSPVQSIIGGITAQEVMKAISGKFTPINQWLYYDAIECLPDNDDDDVSAMEILSKPKGSRYDGQIAVFGEKFQEELAKSKLFLVGAGAIGCEMLKNWAMMGIAVGADGLVTVTDMDSIEKSNLNRQFLFRPKDVAEMKSLTAAAAVRQMNPDMKICAHENRVGKETESVYDDDFFRGLTAVVNALDNVDARKYVDNRCVVNLKPMFDSGTLGTRCSLQVVIPHLTKCYSDTKDAPEKSFPMCTLKHFPVSIEHTLQWARDEFEGLFRQSVETSSKYFAEPDFVEKTRKLDGCKPLELFKELNSVLVEMAPGSFEDCVKWARKKFQENYTNQIHQLLHVYPPDYVSKTGAPFWSGPKRCPTPLAFDEKNEAHLNYVVAAANLVAQIFGLSANRNRGEIAKIVAGVKVDEFRPKSDVHIPANDEEAKAGAEKQSLDSGAVELIEKIVAALPDRNKKLTLRPQDFEKDDDSNFHLDFIVAASNLRAMNYGITPADHHKSKLIVGKIIPAIATTTSVVVGLVCIELYKWLQGKRKIEAFKNAFISLATVNFILSRPTAASKKKYGDVEFTIWDRFEIDGDKTIQQLIDYFKETHNLNVDMIHYGTKCAVYALGITKNPEERLGMTLRKAVEQASKEQLPSGVKSIKLQLGCYDENDEEKEIEVPWVLVNVS